MIVAKIDDWLYIAKSILTVLINRLLFLKILKTDTFSPANFPL